MSHREGVAGGFGPIHHSRVCACRPGASAAPGWLRRPPGATTPSGNTCHRTTNASADVSPAVWLHHGNKRDVSGNACHHTGQVLMPSAHCQQQHPPLLTVVAEVEVQPLLSQEASADAKSWQPRSRVPPHGGAWWPCQAGTPAPGVQPWCQRWTPTCRHGELSIS